MTTDKEMKELINDDKVYEEYLLVRKTWNEAVDTINEMAAGHVTVPMANILDKQVQAQIVRTYAENLNVFDMGKEMRANNIYLFMTGYMIGKQGHELEKRSCSTHDHLHGNN